MRSIRTSLIVGTVLVAVGVIAVAGTTVYRGVRVTMVRQLDQGLENEARLIASAVKMTPAGIELGIDDLDMRDYASGKESSFLQLWLDDGTVLYRSPSLDGRDLERFAEKSDRPLFRWTRLSENPRIRSVALSLQPPVDEEDDEVPVQGSSRSPQVKPTRVNVVMARRATGVDALLGRLSALLIGVGLLSSVVAAGVLAVVIRRSLQPLDHLAGKISQLSSGDLSARVVLPSTPREVEPVVDQLNGLLGRVEAAFQRERTFSADIAHELRTPLSGLRSTIEVAVSRPRQADDYKTTLVELLEITRRLQAMVETLMYLSRLDAGQIETEERVVDLCEIVQASWTTLEAQAACRGLDVQWRLNPEVRVVTDPLLLEVAIRNVLENAVCYANEHGYVSIGVEDEGERTVLRIANSGSTVAQEHVAGLMDRFTRADSSREAAGFHRGLGLSIVSKIAAVLKCSLEIESRVGGEFAVAVSLRNQKSCRTLNSL